MSRTYRQARSQDKKNWVLDKTSRPRILRNRWVADGTNARDKFELGRRVTSREFMSKEQSVKCCRVLGKQDLKNQLVEYFEDNAEALALDYEQECHFTDKEVEEAYDYLYEEECRRLEEADADYDYLYDQKRRLIEEAEADYEYTCDREYSWPWAWTDELGARAHFIFVVGGVMSTCR